MNLNYSEDMLRSIRWIPQRGNRELHEKRCALDDLTTGMVTWTPYTRHRPSREFAQASLYTGFIRHSGMVQPHLPERVLRQFGWIEDVPNLPPAYVSCEVVDEMYADFASHHIQ